MQVDNNGFSQTTAASALAQSSRLDYRLNLLNNTDYFVWMRLRSPPATTAITPVLGPGTAPTATLSPTSGATTAQNDLIIVTTWTTATNGVVPTHGLVNGFTLIASRELNENNNNNKARMSVAFKLAPSAGGVAYEAFTSTNGTSFSGIMVVRDGTFDTATIAATTFADQDGDAANPPNSPNVGSTPSIAFALGALHLGTSASNEDLEPPAATGPDFTEVWELSSNVAADMIAASRVLTSGTIDPESIDDDVNTVQGSVAMTITVGGFPAAGSRSAHVGLTGGTTAGQATQTIQTTVDNQTRWFVTPALRTTVAGVHTFSIYLREDGLMIDTIAIARQNGRSPTADNAWAYQTNPRTEQPQTCNADPFDTDGAATGDQDGILATGSRDACFANQATGPAFDMSGNVKEWTLARDANQNPLRGGASNNEVVGTTCQLSFTLANDLFFFPNVGFRCCRD